MGLINLLILSLFTNLLPAEQIVRKLSASQNVTDMVLAAVKVVRAAMAVF